MHFDSTVSLGNVLTIVGFIIAFWMAAARTYVRIDKRIVLFEQVITQHAATLSVHSVKMDKQDDVLLRLVSDMQRLIGRVEGSQQNIDRAEATARALIDTAAATAKEILATAASVRHIEDRKTA